MSPDDSYKLFPTPIKGPDVPYASVSGSNPVLRGRVLELAASLVYSSSFVQSIIWRNNKFNTLREIKALKEYEPTFDPTVLPPIASATQTGSCKQSQQPTPSTRRRDGEKRFYTSADYHERYKSGELTPTMVVESLLPLIRHDLKPPGEHSIAFSDSKADIILAAAEASTARYRNGSPLGPLDGVPVTVKDEVDLEGYKRTLSSRLDFTSPTGETSWCVKKWEEEGAIIIGKTVMHELGLDTTNNNPIVGTPKNPHNQRYYTGGSSGGPGYAVSAGLVPISLGADGGGSVRIPSAYCGIYGLKTSHGRVSGKPTAGFATSVGAYGPMTSSLDDLALSYRMMARPDPNNQKSAAFPDPQSEISPPVPRQKIIGVYKDWIEQSDPVVKSLFERAIDYYKTQKSYEIVDISIPYLIEGGKAHAISILAEISSAISREQIARLSAPSKILLSISGSQGMSVDFFAAQKLRSLLMSHLSYLFQKYPNLVIATPTTPNAGSKILQGESDLSHGVSNSDATLQSMAFVYLANFTGCPAISCPMGYETGTNIPVGIMGMGEWGSEEALIEWGRDGEGVLNGDNGEDGLRVPDTEKGGKWVDAIRLAESYAVPELVSSE